MGLFDKFKAGLAKTHAKLTHEIKRIVTRSPKLTADSIEELEAALIAADLGMAMTEQIISAVKKNYESQGGAGLDFLAIARGEIEKKGAHRPDAPLNAAIPLTETLMAFSPPAARSDPGLSAAPTSPNYFKSISRANTGIGPRGDQSRGKECLDF